MAASPSTGPAGLPDDHDPAPTTSSPPTSSPPTALVRTATAEDVEGIVAVCTEAFGRADEPGVRSYLTGPGARAEHWAVAVADGRVVATSALLPLTLVLDGHEIPAGQIEYVATDPAHRRQGLVRAQFAHHHARAADAGMLALVIGGIPYLYRRFGYGYGISYPALHLYRREDLSPDPATTIRPANGEDVPRLQALDAARPVEALRVARRDHHWHRRLAVAGHPTEALEGWPPGTPGPELFVVAERDGVVEGWLAAYLHLDDREWQINEGAATDDGVADALLAHVADLAARGDGGDGGGDSGGDGEPFLVLANDTAGTGFGRRVREVGRRVPYDLGLYVRFPDPVALLDHLRPVLSARLAGTEHETGTLDVSLYESGIRLHLADHRVEAVEAIAGEEDPFDEQGVGVAPDWLPALVFGRWGARELAERCDDVTLGRHHDLLATLFPHRDADVVGEL